MHRPEDAEDDDADVGQRQEEAGVELVVALVGGNCARASSDA
ncbi:MULTISPECIES: hypothetical protein [unclassified Pseudoclavibacter]|nr:MULTISPECIES: hypothetical protein [unclassified Pseudoclavibacter]